MSAAPIRQSQLTRALKALRAAGVPAESLQIEIAPDGSHKIFSQGDKPGTADVAFDQWEKQYARKA